MTLPCGLRSSTRTRLGLSVSARRGSSRRDAPRYTTSAPPATAAGWSAFTRQIAQPAVARTSASPSRPGALSAATASRQAIASRGVRGMPQRRCRAVVPGRDADAREAAPDVARVHGVDRRHRALARLRADEVALGRAPSPRRARAPATASTATAASSTVASAERPTSGPIAQPHGPDQTATSRPVGPERRQDHEADGGGQDRPARQPGRTVPARRALHERRSRDPEQAQERGGDDEVGGAAARDAAIVPGDPDDHERAARPRPPRRPRAARAAGGRAPARRGAAGAPSSWATSATENTTGPWTAPQRTSASRPTSAIDGPHVASARGVATSASASLRGPVDERAADHERDEHVVDGLQAAEEPGGSRTVAPEAADVAHARARGDGVRHRRAASPLSAARPRTSFHRPSVQHLPVAQHDRAVGDAVGEAHLVRGEEDRLALGLGVEQELSQQRLRRRVEADDRLVEHEEPRRADERAREAGLLAHAARELGGQEVRALGEPELVDERVDARRRAVVEDAVRERHEPEVLADGQVVVEQRRVGDERERGPRLLGVGLGVRIVAADRARCRRWAPAARPSCGWRSTCRCRSRR